MSDKMSLTNTATKSFGGPKLVKTSVSEIYDIEEESDSYRESRKRSKAVSKSLIFDLIRFDFIEISIILFRIAIYIISSLIQVRNSSSQ